MPNDTSGFTGNEIVSRVVKYVGNTTTEFQTYIQNTLPLAEFRFCKAHDWEFLHKTNLSLAVTNGTREYELSVANIGYYMSAENVESIYHEDKGVYLKRKNLQEIRRFDPQNDDGSATDTPTMWAPSGDNKILLWPPTFETSTLKIDGKVSPGALSTLTNFPTIPYRYQESFIEYVVAMALDRENDDRASSKKQEALALIREDIKDDLRQLSNVENPRIQSMREARFDGSGANLDGLFFGWLDHYCD
jgi:hypothetical protein